MPDETKKMKLEDLFRKVVTTMSEDLASFADRLGAGSTQPDEFDKAYAIAHSLHGAGALYGYRCVSDLGASLEKLVRALAAHQLGPTARAAELIRSCAGALRVVAGPQPAAESVTDKISELAWDCECLAHRPDSVPQPSRQPPSPRATS